MSDLCSDSLLSEVQVILIISLLPHQMVWPGEGLQCPSHGPAWTQSGGSVQLLLSSLHHEDSPYAGRPGS